jgi:nitroreductase
MLDLQVLEIANAMERRQSSRVPFDPTRRIPDPDLQRILEAARWAPTPHNMQNFEIVAVDDRKIMQQIAALRSVPSETFLRENYEQLAFSEEELQRKGTGLLARMFPSSWRSANAKPEDGVDFDHSFLGRSLQDAPLLLIVVYDARRRAPASEGDVLGIMSLGCVLQNMWLMATVLNIDVQILTAFAGENVEAAVQRILGIPAHMRIAFACRLGYSTTLLAKYPRVRREAREFTYYNQYGSRGPD